MALNEVRTIFGTAIVIADTTDYAGDLGTRSDQIDLTSLAAGSARQSAKFSLEIATNKLAPIYAMYAAIEFDVAPTSGDMVDFWVGFSPSATAGTANPGGTSGSDAAYTGTAGDSLNDSIRSLEHVGTLVATSDAATVVQFALIGYFTAPTEDAVVVVKNNTDQAFEGDAVEMGILIVPMTPEIE